MDVAVVTTAPPRGGRTASALAALALLVAAAALTEPLWAPALRPFVPASLQPPPAAGDRQAVAAIEARVAEIERRLQQAGGGDSQALVARVAAIEQRLRSRMPEPATGDALAKLREDLAQLGEQVSAMQWQISALNGRPAEEEEEGTFSEGVAQEIDQIRQRVSALETFVAASIDEMGTRVGDEIATRLDSVVAAMNERVDRIRARAEAASQRAAAIEQRVASVLDRPEPATAAGLDAQKAEIERSLGAIAGRVAAIEGALAPVQRTVAALDAKARRGGGEEAALLLAVGQLRAAIASGSPFADEIATLRGLAPSEPGWAARVDALAPHARAGIPTLARLRERFPDMARAAARAALAGSDGTLVDRTLQRLAELVSIRPTSDASGQSDPKGNQAQATAGALLARAEARLGAGDLQGSVEALRSLPAVPAAAAATWLADARARLDAESALAAMTAAAIGGLARPAAPAAK
ncbi:MAG: hypothetical protein JNK11_07815 [Alphaproteobacteria bacterium]|nr:hypothetical protein [Alphaproteobacteria bacterium]